MDLKTFAVSAKLHRDQELLAYVMNNEDVPVHVIADAFGPLLAKETDVKAERLVNDYVSLLVDEVPIRIRKDASEGFEISGDIPDTLLEAITLVHGDAAETAVNKLIDFNLKQVCGTSCDILSTELTESVKKTFMEVSNLPQVEPVYTGEPNESSFFGTEEEKPPVMEAASEEDIFDDLFANESEETLFSESQIPAEPKMSEVSETYHTDMFDAGSDVNMAEDVSEVDEISEGRRFAQAIRRVYDKLVADIHAYGLDGQLNLQI